MVGFLYNCIAIYTALPMVGGVCSPCSIKAVGMGSRGADGNLRCIRLPGGFVAVDRQRSAVGVAVYDGRMDGTAVGIFIGGGNGGGTGNGEIPRGIVTLHDLNGGAVGGIVGDVESGIGNGDIVRPKRRAIIGGGREGDAGDGKIAKHSDCRTALCSAQG